MMIPSPIEVLNHPLLEDRGVQLLVKRDDLIHADISGNKWRKLKYNVLRCQQEGKKGIVTLGGAFSNHIAATACTCYEHGLVSVGLIRGAHVDRENPTLFFAQQHGMKIVPLDKQTYNLRNDEGFKAWVHKQYPELHLVPEGGANYYGVAGCAEILPEVEQEFDVVALALGTGTTFAGVLASLGQEQKGYAVQVLKAPSLENNVSGMIAYFLGDQDEAAHIMRQAEIDCSYHLGGYAKRSAELEAFVSSFHQTTGLKLDPVYTGKLFFALFDGIERGKWASGTRILAIHTGGLQGIKGYENRYGVKFSFS